VLWGLVFIFIKIAVEDFPLFTLVTLRLVLAALFLLIYALIKGYTMPKPGRAWFSFFILGLFNCTFPYLLITWGEKKYKQWLAAILKSTMPYLLMCWPTFLLRMKNSSVRILGIILGLCGVKLNWA
jgi:drug/metabolite transporter (DMT)-like permease